MTFQFKGILTALITPFLGDKIDYSALYGLLDKQIEAGVDGVIIGGSTGEGNNLSLDEYYELIAASVKYVNKTVPIIAGVGASSTKEATDKVTKLCKLGVDGLMCTAPHYVRPEQSGLILHYQAISAASTLPIMVYLHPVRTACDFTDETLLQIAKFENVTGVKDATNDLEKPLRLMPHLTNVNMLTGDDLRILSYSANGGSGCVSVISNLLPKLCKKIDNLLQAGNFSEALALQQKLVGFALSINIESNPIGIKYALSKMNLCSKEIRLPLTYCNKDNAKIIDDTLQELIIMENNT